MSAPSHTNVLSDRDVNASLQPTTGDAAKPDVKSMEYHRQVLQSKMEEDKSTKYISPSDNIMSPCTAKLNAFRNKQVGKVKPKSLFAQASVKRLEVGAEELFGANKSIPAVPRQQS